MATDLFTPVLNDRTRAPYYFNGRLLTGEAMTDEQRAQRVAHELLAQGLGDGVVCGLQVALSNTLNRVDNPVVTVKAGTAISRHGDLLVLPADTDVQLVRPAHQAAAPQKIFDACTPPQQGTYVADAGVYLLTIAPIGVGNGLAAVSGVGTTTQSCNVKYRVDAVEFRLVELPVAQDILSDSNRMRNLVAYACFGVEHLADFVRDPFGPREDSPTLLDQIRGTSLSDCDVPLAVAYWSATGGIQFVDNWSVRRRLTRTRSAGGFPAFTDTRLAVAEAMLLQFQEHLAAVSAQTVIPLTSVSGKTFARWLPPAGYVPIRTGSGGVGFDVDTFFAGKTWNRQKTWASPPYMEGGMVEALFRESTKYPPVDLDDPEMVWLYWVRQNIRAMDTGAAVTPYVVFANANLPFFGEARLDRAHWNYSNFV